jgi:UDP-N-acetylmuramate dehydrogenase
MRLAARGDLVTVHSVESLQRLLPLLRAHNREYLLLGWGANQILPPKPQELVIQLELPAPEGELQELRTAYRLPASIGLNQLTAAAIRLGLLGWEVFTGIPASLGGAIYMNAGTALGEIGSLVTEVELVTPEGELRTERIGPSSFAYRKNHFVRGGEVIVGAVLSHRGSDPAVAQRIRDYLGYRKSTQPLATRNCGCVFKNPRAELPAGRLIDSLGLKGVRLGDLRVSERHGNFIENTGRADWDQFSALLELIRWHADVFLGLEFELEVKIPYH